MSSRAAKRRKTVTFWLAVALLLPVLYVLSYAPVMKAYVHFNGRGVGSVGGYLYVDGNALPAYRSVDWLIDNTPLDVPLIWWAELWGVEEDFAWAALVRFKLRQANQALPPVDVTQPPNEGGGKNARRKMR